MSEFFNLVQSTLDEFLVKADVLKNSDHDHEEEKEGA